MKFIAKFVPFFILALNVTIKWNRWIEQKETISAKDIITLLSCQYIHVTSAPFFVNAGLLFVGVCYDITDRRRGKGAAVLF